MYLQSPSLKRSTRSVRSLAKVIQSGSKVSTQIQIQRLKEMNQVKAQLNVKLLSL